MRCPYCERNNPDDSSSCTSCGMPLPVSSKTSNAKPQKVKSQEQSHNHFCPHCGALGTDCTPVIKTEVSSTGGGYGLLRGCCGGICLGPFGLLCGIKKQRITSTNQTWWICKNCGSEFVSKEAAREILGKGFTSMAMVTFLTTLILEIIKYILEYGGWGTGNWLSVIIVLGLIVFWYALPEAIQLATGRDLAHILEKDELGSLFYKQCIVYGLGSFLLGIMIGRPILEYFFG